MAAAVRLSDQFLCSICLEVFNEPVSTPCGHNFCKTCITQAWALSYPCSCPLCKEVFIIKPELKTNTFIKEMMISQLRLERSDSMHRLISLLDESTPVSVHCDLCADPKLTAVKSCQVCLLSFCETHLQPHLTAPGLKRHQLMEPVDNLEDRICPKHNKPLELFCSTDHSCICTMCPLLEHKNHQFVSLEEEVHLRRSSLQQTQAETQHMVEQRRLKIQEIGCLLELSDKAVDRERALGLQVFTSLMQSVQKSQQKFIEELQEKHRQTQKQAQDLISELEQEICDLEKTSSELEQLSRSEDNLHFIQSTISLRPAADLTPAADLSFETHTYEGSAARVLSELKDFLNKDINMFALKRVQQFAVDVTLDPDTAARWLVLSEDLKQVHNAGVEKDLPDTPQRFDSSVNVLGKQSFSSGRFYFEVQVKGKTKWDLGVAQESINRKGSITVSPKNGYWSIMLRNRDEYKACTGPSVRLSSVRRPQKVGVFVDYSDGVVSFYDVDSADLIFSFTGCSFNDKLLPFFSTGNSDKGSNSSPLVITPVCV